MKITLSQGVAILAAIVFSFQGCTQANFTSTDSPSKGAEGTLTGNPDVGNTADGSIQTCGTVLRTITTGVKLLFIVDTSGSNFQSGPRDPTGTDPGRAMRSGSIEAFFKDFGAKSNFSWGFLTFAGSSATALIRNGAVPVFSPNAADMRAAIDEFGSIPDAGGQTRSSHIQRRLLRAR